MRTWRKLAAAIGIAFALFATSLSTSTAGAQELPDQANDAAVEAHAKREVAQEFLTTHKVPDELLERAAAKAGMSKVELIDLIGNGLDSEGQLVPAAARA